MALNNFDIRGCANRSDIKRYISEASDETLQNGLVVANRCMNPCRPSTFISPHNPNNMHISGVYTSEILSMIIDQIGERRMKQQATRRGRMSPDRIHFTIVARNLEERKYRDLIAETLGISASEYSNTEDLNVICRPSQFGRFIALRHDKYGIPNNVSQLKAKLVQPAEDKMIDCSGNPNTATAE